MRTRDATESLRVAIAGLELTEVPMGSLVLTLKTATADTP